MDLHKYTIQRRDNSRSALAPLDYSITVKKHIWGLYYYRTYYNSNVQLRWKNSLGQKVRRPLQEKLDRLFPIKITPI